MKKILVLFFIFVCFAKSGFPQTPIEIKAGKGYFAEPHYFLHPDLGWDDRLKYNPKFYGKIINGSATWFEISYKMKTGYNVGFNFMNGATSQYYNDFLGFYWDTKIYRVFDYYSLSFLKDFRFGKHCISPGFGLSCRVFKESYCDYDVRFTEDDPTWVGEDGTLYSYPSVDERILKDLGIELKVDYQYYITKQLSMGVRFSANVPFGIGLHSVLVSPFISINLNGI
jgi:hypothetical protein